MSLNAAALEVSDQEGDKVVTPIIDSIIDGDFATLTNAGGGLSNWNMTYSDAWELGFSTEEEEVIYTDWDLPTIGALLEIRSLIDSGTITDSNGFNLFDTWGGWNYWSSTEVAQTVDSESVPEIPSIGDTLLGGKVYWIDYSESKAYVVADGWSANLFANEWGCDGTEIDQGNNSYGITSGSGNSWNMINQCSDTNTPAWACDNFDTGYTGWYLPSIYALRQIYESGLYSSIGLDTSKLYWSSTQYGADEAKVYAFDDISLPISSTTYNDWYLPSIDELEEMYTVLGSLTWFWGKYWSSTEYTSVVSYVYGTYNDSVMSEFKGTFNYYRPIRTATSPTNLPPGQNYEGGKIFYNSNGLCLIADKVYSSPLRVWGCQGQKITGADGSAIGTGEQNTLDILAACNSATSAAKACDDYSVTDETTAYYSQGIHEVSKSGILTSGQTQIFTRPVRHGDYNVVTPKAYSLNFHEYDNAGFLDAAESDKYNTYRIRPVRTATILESDGVYNVGDSLYGGKVFHKSTTQEVGGATQILQIVANNNAASGMWNCYNEWNITGMSVSGVASSSFATTQIESSGCTSSTEATQACFNHTEPGFVEVGSTWGLISNSTSWLPIYIRQLCTHIGQDYTLSITVENLTSGEGVLSVSGGVDSSFNETITTSNTHTFSFTSDSEYIYINSLQGIPENFTGVITNISLNHENIVLNYEEPVGIAFPVIPHESNSIDLGSTEHSETQTIELLAGWNIFSLWIDAEGDYDGADGTFATTDGADLMAVFMAQDGWEAIEIVKNNDGSAWLPVWYFNGIGDFVNGQGYQIKVANDCTFTFTGNPIHTDIGGGNQVYGMTLELKGGWNCIAAPWKPGLVIENQTSLGYDAEIFFEPVIDDLIIAKNNWGDAYLVQWSFNGIGELLSGQGYFVKMEGDSSDTYYIDATYTPDE